MLDILTILVKNSYNQYLCIYLNFIRKNLKTFQRNIFFNISLKIS